MKKFWLMGMAVMMVGCQRPAPAPIVLPAPVVHHTPKQISDSGKITRDLYRSFWVLPSKDSDSIALGLLPSSPKITFSSTQDFRIRVHEEYRYWDILAPAGATWTVEKSEEIRPALVRYFVTIDNQLIGPGQFVENNRTLDWIQKGYKHTQWVGPPKMDARNQKKQLLRYFLSVEDFTDAKQAQDFCDAFRKKHRTPCRVIGRIELPLLGQGILRAKQSNFSRKFQGVIELIPPSKGSVVIYNVPVSMMTDETKNIPIQDQTFVLPNAQEAFTVVEKVSLGRYLEGVLPSEIYPSAPLEALKSQAVIARTYTLSQLWSNYATEPFYTCITTQCQAYHGKKQRHRNVERAIQSTQNMVLKKSDQAFAQTFYHASSGGKTDSATSIFRGTPTAYPGGTVEMLSKPIANLQNETSLQRHIINKSPTYCSVTRFSNKHVQWKRTLSAKELKHIFGAPVTNIIVVTRSVSGRITKMRVTTTQKTITLSDQLVIRQKFKNLPSSMMFFDVKQNTDGLITSLTIMGRGYGHGVGLSQLGAIGRAQSGQDFSSILKAYYPNTRLSTILD